MTVKTDYSRFDVHDVLTAPEGSVKFLEGVSRTGEITKFIGVLAGSPSALRAYARMRHELRGGALPQATRERIALAVAERRGDPYSIAQHARTARGAVRPRTSARRRARPAGPTRSCSRPWPTPRSASSRA
jgi:AhpD family alkylhydroperoxidase